MSEILLGVLNMPPELWSDDPIDVAQRHSCYKEVAKEIADLKAQLAESRSLHDLVTLLKVEPALSEYQQIIQRMEELEAQLAAYELTDYWLISRYRGPTFHSELQEEVIKGPLTDDMYMDEGDEAVSLYKIKHQ